MTPSDLTRLEAIRERLVKATKGPWMATDERCSNVVDILRLYMGGSDEIAQVYAEDELTEQQRYDADFIAHAWEDIAWLLARLAPATPSGAATAGDAREEENARVAHAALRPQVVIDPRDPERKAVAFVLDATLSRIAEGVRVLTVDVGFDFGGGPLQRHVKRVHVPPVAPASAERSGAAPEGPATPSGAPNPTCAHCGPERACADHAAPPAAGSREATPHEH